MGRDESRPNKHFYNKKIYNIIKKRNNHQHHHASCTG